VDFNQYPADVKEDHLFLTNWLCELAQKYQNKIRIKIINASSLRGVFKSIRFWTQTYPTFIVNKKETYCGSDKSRLDIILKGHLGRL
jgi:hypothetical protein